MVICSFDAILRQRRRIHSLDLGQGRRFALWRPITWMGCAYFALAELVILALDNFISFIAILNALLSSISGGNATIVAWIICYVAAPAAIVWLAMNSEIDGRAPHSWVASSAQFLVKYKHTCCGERARGVGEKVRYRGRIRFWWDADAPRLQHGWVRGGRVHTRSRACFSHAIRHRHPTLDADERGHEITGYDVADLLEVRP